MTGFIAEVAPNFAETYDENATGGGGKFPPLPGGKYVATIVPLKKDGSQLVEVADFGGNGGNAKKKVVRIALKIVDESPTGKGRYIHARVPLFSQFASGKENRAFGDFWVKAIGWPKERIEAGQMPGPQDIMGKRVGITLSDPKPAESDYDKKNNPLGVNEVDWYDKAGDPQAAPRRTPGVPVAPWLDADDNLIEEWAPAAAAPAAAPAAIPSWATPATGTVAPTPSAATLSWGNVPSY